ncbi:MAG: YopX family protein [Dehalococcoidia bacterium]
MREIKFRGLGVDGKWWYGEPNPQGENHVNLATFFANVHAGAIRPETVGEFTGLKDKNGKEIYEGDIVGEKGWAYKVEFEDGMFRLAHSTLLVDWIYARKRQGIETKVIGNIYENPELLG